MNRRAFLRGAAGVAVALPFLESLPERSAWAADAKPVFSLFICAVGGVVPAQFFPSARGPLTKEGLAAAGKATSELAAHADDLLFLSGIDWSAQNSGDSHVQGMCISLTARAPQGENQNTMSTGPSADVLIASKVHPGLAPLTLYAGNQKNGFSAERLSFASSGQVNAATGNPYTLYQQLVGLASPGGAMTPAGEQAARLLLQSRNSIHDLVREDLSALLKHPRLSSDDRKRLELHLASIRDAEITMDDMGDAMVDRCTSQGLDIDKLEALKTFVYDAHHTTEEAAKLHMSLVALAFACNYRRSATLQWGDPYDLTIYDVPSNDRQWKFNYISHRAQSDSAVGNDELAAQAHAEIDAVRMQSLAAGLDHFAARGLRDQCFVMWTNQYAEGPSHSFRNVPHIIWGNAGGYLKRGAYLDAGNTPNNRLLNTLISAAIQDTGTTMEDFGQGVGGQFDAIRA